MEAASYLASSHFGKERDWPYPSYKKKKKKGEEEEEEEEDKDTVTTTTPTTIIWPLFTGDNNST